MKKNAEMLEKVLFRAHVAFFGGLAVLIVCLLVLNSSVGANWVITACVIVGIVASFGGLLYAFLVERNFKFPDKLLLGYGALSGVLVAGIVFFMATSVNLGNASIVLPIAQMSFLGTLLLSVLFLKEKVDILKIIAVLSGTAAILLLVQ